MANKIKVACIQMTSGPEISLNLQTAERLIRDAAAGGAMLVATPENTCHILGIGISKLDTAPFEADHPALPLFSGLAKELGIWLLIGSLSVRLDDKKLANRSYFFGPDGLIKATYDKIHLFDADLPTGERYRESDLMAHGDQIVVVDAGFAKLGLSICYDVRFPSMFREMAKRGAEILMVPAAFAATTGKLHWEVLLRARAIENTAYVLAPAQTGEHAQGRLTYGRAMIVDPWGTVIADAGTEVGVLFAEIDLDEVRRARQSLPCLTHDRDAHIQSVCCH